MSFSAFYKSFGLNDFPFTTYATEQELAYAKELFIAQGEYDPIIEAFNSGRTIIITGMERIGLIENVHKRKGNILYRIKDPKIVYAVEKQLEIKK
ncbi:MAG: hypothetical protein JXD23_08650 [Spirochaetales bacterium]|nr:hypothetical protein [Spirochaetales bacterium]